MFCYQYSSTIFQDVMVTKRRYNIAKCHARAGQSSQQTNERSGRRAFPSFREPAGGQAAGGRTAGGQAAGATRKLAALQTVVSSETSEQRTSLHLPLFTSLSSRRPDDWSWWEYCLNSNTFLPRLMVTDVGKKVRFPSRKGQRGGNWWRNKFVFLIVWTVWTNVFTFTFSLSIISSNIMRKYWEKNIHVSKKS